MMWKGSDLKVHCFPSVSSLSAFAKALHTSSVVLPMGQRDGERWREASPGVLLVPCWERFLI